MTPHKVNVTLPTLTFDPAVVHLKRSKFEGQPLNALQRSKSEYASTFLQPDQYYDENRIANWNKGYEKLTKKCESAVIVEKVDFSLRGSDYSSSCSDKQGDFDEDVDNAEMNWHKLSSTPSPSASAESSSSGPPQVKREHGSYLQRIDGDFKETWTQLFNQKYQMKNHGKFSCRYKSKESFQHLIDEFQELTNRHRHGIRKLGKKFANFLPLKDDDSKTSSSVQYSSNEKAHLQQRLKSLSSELVSLRHHLHVNNTNNNCESGNGPTHHSGIGGILNSNPILQPMSNNNGQNTLNNPSPPRILSVHTTNGQNSTNHLRHTQVTSLGLGPSPHPITNNGGGYTKPLPRPPLSHPGIGGMSILSNQHSSSITVQNSQSSGYYVNQQFPKDVLRGDLNVEDKPPGSMIGTRTTSSGGDATPSVSSHSSSFKLSMKSANNLTYSANRNTPIKKVQLSTVEDLIHLAGPLTEDSLIRSIQARCTAGKHFVYMGPILLIANPLNAVGNALTLNSTQRIIPPAPVQKIVQEALRQQADTGYPQAIILSGCSGSGKTYMSMLVLRQLFQTAGGGLETDAFKHLTASVAVLRSLGTARTASNAESSRIGHFIEVQVTDRSLYRTKVHCYFLDQTRVVRTSADERNYHIFYQMLAGLSLEERSKLHLGKHSAKTLRYLNSCEQQSDEAEDARRFFDWKTCLCVLGIPFLDVVRVLAAVVLIGNVKFTESSTSCLDLNVEEGESELQSVASLLGVSETALRQGLTMRTHNTRGHLVRSRCDANLSNTTRDALAKSLYCRTVATIVRRANSLKRLSSNSGTLSSDSADSVHNQAEVASQHASTVGTAGSKASKSMTALMAAVRHATDGFIGILDMFGFEDGKRSHLEHLCINLCAETMQHFYNTHIFKACVESCREEGLQCDDIEYHDNVPCIDLISSLRTGLLSMLDVECSVRGTVESYVQKVRSQHNQNPRFLETKATDLRSFAIQHYAGKVYYDVTDFPETNRDVLADDLVAVFHKHRCSFGFASHLFSSELKVLGAGGTVDPCPKGISFRILPTSNTEMLNGDEPVSTLTQDFHTRLDNLLRTLVHAKPHFIRCLKINHSEQPDLFDRHTVSKQLRAFQVLETVNLMAYGYPHRMRFKAFNGRYKLLAPFHQLSRTDDRAIEDCQRILESFDNFLDSLVREKLGHISMGWALGKRHVFLSEGARQQLETLRISTRNRAATLIQTTYRGWYCRRRWPIVRQTIQQRFQHFEKKNIDHHHPMVMAHIIEPNSKDQDPHNRHCVPIASHRNSNFLNSLHGSHGKFGQVDSGILHQAFPVPSQRTSSTAVITSVHVTNTLNSCTSGGDQNYKNVQSISQLQNTVPGNGIHNNMDTLSSRPRPQPIAGTPPPDVMDRPMPIPDQKLVQQTCCLYGLDMERPPPLPPSRTYTINGSRKFTFPQTRCMKMNFPDEGTSGSEVRLCKGDAVVVVGASPRRGHLIVEYKKRTLHLPYQYLELKVSH